MTDPQISGELPGPGAHEAVPDAVADLVRQVGDSLPGISVLLYDTGLHIIAAGGQPLERAGFDPAAMVGRHLADILGESFPKLEPHLQTGLQGRESRLTFLSPLNGLEYGVACRGIRGPDGQVIAGLMTNQDLTEDLRRRSQLEEVQRLSQVGSATFDRIHGWRADPELLAVFGVADAEPMPHAWETLVLDDDRLSVQAAYQAVLESGGRKTVRYRIRQPRTGAIRSVQGGFMAEVDDAGELLRAVVTHVDVTAAVDGERLRAKAAHDRTRLLRRVSDILAQGTDDRQATIQRIADVAAVAIAGQTLVRVITLIDGQTDLNVLSEADLDDPDFHGDAIRRTVRSWTPPAALLTAGHAGAHLFSSIGNPDWRTDYRQQTGHPIHPAVAHFISAPVRHDGQVLGFVRAFRLQEDPAFETGDDDLLQVIADRVGTVVGETRFRTLLQRQLDRGETLAERVQQLTSDQRELLQQLSQVEERERLLLAEALHDDPMQLVVAATIQLDTIAARSGPGGADLDKLVDILEEAIGKLRTLIIALTPPDLEDGLGVALKRLAEAVFVLDESVQVDVTGHDHVSLSPHRKMNACRILREGLVNARKHANATRIWLDIEETGGLVTITLRDNGVGASTFESRPGHLGMATMRGRAATEGGSLDITTAPGEGTTLTLALPVDASAVTQPHHL